ncbi:MAG: hypothetical protein IKM27_03805 [Clostridia bacterium]|nr:hypothetical protein [Clostridia bacterium]
MKFSKRLFLRSALSLLLAVCLLTSGLMLMGMTEADDKDVETDSLAPDVSDLVSTEPEKEEDAENVALPENENEFFPGIIDTTVPVPQEQLAGKFGQYSLASVYDGKKVVSIYTEEQIADIVARTEQGETFVLTAEDVLFIIDDTVKLFSEYDVISVTGLDGVTVSYPGVSFYSSEEYKNCFGGFDYGVNDISFNIESDIWNVILTRVKVLNTAFYEQFGVTTVYTDNDGSINEDNMWILAHSVRNYFGEHELSSEYVFAEALAPHDTGVFVFSGNRSIKYVEQMNCGNRDAAIALYPDGLIPENLDAVKYDVDGKAVIIELWDIKGEKMVARLRYDGEENGKIVSDIEGLWEGFKAYLHSEDYRKVSGEEYMSSVSDYRIAVFFVGMDGLHSNHRVSALRFGADAYQDNCQLHFGGGIDEMSEPCQLSGSQAIADYVISLLKEELVTE